MLKDEFQYYLDNQNELVAQYEHKVLVIKDQKVVGVYENEIDAYKESITKYELGTFLIQQCEKGSKNYTQTYYNKRVTFA